MNLAASVKDRLLNLARQRGEDFNRLLERFVLERFLYRLSRSEHRDLFVLKGAMLFTVWLPGQPLHRATRDLDLLGFGPPDPELLLAKFHDILSWLPEEGDGLNFSAQELKAEPINYLRPVLLTGIGGLHGKADLGDRVLKVTLNPIEGSARIAEEIFEKRIEEMRPRMLGALLDVAATALRNKDNVPLPALPRMADFAKTIVEAEEALPWESGDFLAAFDEARQEQIEAAIEGDSLAQALRDLASIQPHWEGSATDLVARLNKLKADARRLPAANKLQVHLRLLAPSLRAVGVLVTFHKTNGRRLVKVTSEAKSGMENARPETRPTYAPTPPLQQCVFSGMVPDYRAPQTVAKKPSVQEERALETVSSLIALTG